MAHNPFSLLAQEIIDLIVDEVARGTPSTYHDQSEKDILACALVDKAFYSRAQTCLVSNIHIRAGEGFEAYATPLLERIKNGPTDLSAPILRSLCCAIVADADADRTLNPRSPSRHPPHPTALDRVYAHLGDPFLEILRTISSPESKTQHFSLVAMSELSRIRPLPGDQGTSPFQKALSEACTAVNLKTLHLANLGNIPGSKIVDAFFLPCLEELTLNNLSLEETEVGEMTTGMLTHSGNSSLRTLAPELKRLEIRNISYLSLFRFLNLLSPPGPSSNSSFAFPRLNSLIISLLFDEQRFPIFGALSTIWSFMVTVSSTLTSLEIESYAYPIGPHVHRHFNSHSTRICLGRLPALRTFRLTICHDTCLDFLRKLLMDSVRNPTTIESFEIKLTLSAHDRQPIHSFTEHKYWTHLDTRLTEPMFEKLRRVRIIVVLFHSRAKSTSLQLSRGLAPGDWSEHSKIEEHWKSIFPKVAASLSLVVDVQDVYSQNTLEAYLYASRTDDGIVDCYGG